MVRCEMGRSIVRLVDDSGELWIEWSSIVDAPVFVADSRQDFEAYYLEEYGGDGMRDLSKRMERVLATGTSSYRHESNSMRIDTEATVDETVQYDVCAVPVGWIAKQHKSCGVP